MRAYCEGVGAVFGNPRVRGKARVHKVENFIVKRVALKADFSRYDGIGIWRFINTAVCHGRKLRAVFFIENNAVNAIWELCACHAVHHYVAHGYFAAKGLRTAFCIDYARKPVDLVSIVI